MRRPPLELCADERHRRHAVGGRERQQRRQPRVARQLRCRVHRQHPEHHRHRRSDPRERSRGRRRAELGCKLRRQARKLGLLCVAPRGVREVERGQQLDGGACTRCVAGRERRARERPERREHTHRHGRQRTCPDGLHRRAARARARRLHRTQHGVGTRGVDRTHVAQRRTHRAQDDVHQRKVGMLGVGRVKEEVGRVEQCAERRVRVGVVDRRTRRTQHERGQGAKERRQRSEQRVEVGRLPLCARQHRVACAVERVERVLQQHRTHTQRDPCAGVARRDRDAPRVGGQQRTHQRGRVAFLDERGVARRRRVRHAAQRRRDARLLCGVERIALALCTCGGVRRRLVELRE